MKNIDFSKLGIGKYLRELSIVIIGIAVTLFANDQINESSAQKKLNQQLKAIKIELEQNSKNLDRFIYTYEAHRQFAKEFKKYKEAPLTFYNQKMDSLKGCMVGLAHCFSPKMLLMPSNIPAI